jgi:hypothetical protein
LDVGDIFHLMHEHVIVGECVKKILNDGGMGELRHMVLMSVSTTAPSVGDV